MDHVIITHILSYSLFTGILIGSKLDKATRNYNETHRKQCEALCHLFKKWINKRWIQKLDKNLRFNIENEADIIAVIEYSDSYSEYIHLIMEILELDEWGQRTARKYSKPYMWVDFTSPFRRSLKIKYSSLTVRALVG